MEIIKQQSFNKTALKNALRDFIDDSRQNIENKSHSINLILQTMKEENEQIVSKSKKYSSNFTFLIQLNIFSFNILRK